jgi:hypothetical protein
MDLIEQAVFTSAETDHGGGYQVVATSPGVCDADLRELAVWGPSHDALAESSPNAVSFNFHPLPSGTYCVSRTTPAGWEYSGRGARVYTQCLIVSPEVLARFANNPFALLRAALANGALRVYDKPPAELDALRLAGRAAAVDATLLTRLAANPGPEWMASLVQAALDAVTIAVIGGPPADHLVAGLFNCLPPECRTEFSFSTGLKFSSRRPFRVVALSGDREEQHRIERLYNVAILRINEEPPVEFTPIDSWARLILRTLKSGRISFLASQLNAHQGEVAMEDLSALGLQYLEEFDATALAIDTAEDTDDETPEGPSAAPHPAPAPAPPPSDEITLAHAPHQRLEGESRAPAALKCKENAPSKLLHPNAPEVLRILEELDDQVYEAIAGDPSAMEQLKLLWPRARAELGEELLAESRAEYLRYALSIWEECLGPEGIRQPERAVQSLDVLCLLFDQA